MGNDASIFRHYKHSLKLIELCQHTIFGRARTHAPTPSVEGGGGPGESHVQHIMNNNNVREEANQPELFDPIDLIGDDFDMPEKDSALRNASLEPNSRGPSHHTGMDQEPGELQERVP